MCRPMVQIFLEWIHYFMPHGHMEDSKKKLYNFSTTNRVVCLYSASMSSTFEIDYRCLNLISDSKAMFWWNCFLCKLKKSYLICTKCCLNVLKDIVFSELHTFTNFWINTDIKDRWMLLMCRKVNYFSTSLIPFATSAKLVVCDFIIALTSNSKFCHVWSSYSQIC